MGIIRFDGLRRAMAGLLAVGLLLAALGTASADAATYTVWSCRGPDGSPLSTEAWEPDSLGAATADSCSTGGFLRARIDPGMDVFSSVHGYRFATPAGASIAAYRLYLFARTDPSDSGDDYQAGLDVSPGETPVIEPGAGCATSGCKFGEQNVALDPSNLLESANLKAGGLFVGARCTTLSACIGSIDSSALAVTRLFSSEVAIRDDALPVVGAPTGNLAAQPQPISGSRTMGGAVSDEGGGLASVALLIDGSQVAQVPATCSQPYTAPTPCPPSLVASFDVDSTSLTLGAHSAELRATDAAGNQSTGPAVSFMVATPPPGPQPPPAPQPSPVAVPVEPTVVRLAVSRSRLAVEGKSRVTGTVKLVGGAPVAGAKVIVRSRPFGVRRSSARRERTLTTDSQGRFSMSADGASRLLELDVDDKTYRAEEARDVQLLQRLRVEATQNGRGLRNGSTMTLHADVDGAGHGARGKGALVQAIVAGRWTTVEELTLNDSGGAVWRYRFTGTTRSAIYRFRVRVPTAGDVWPWPTTDSPVLKVRVKR
jgi:hypothetical protein